MVTHNLPLLLVSMRGTWYCHFHTVPVATGVEPSNLGSLVVQPTNSNSAANLNEIIIVASFSFDVITGWIWNHELRVICKLCYQFFHCPLHHCFAIFTK
jgi:hypothetical protein